LVLKYAEALKTAGVDENQARAQAHALAEAFKEGVGTLATREDLGEVKNILQTEIAQVKTELRAEIVGVKTEFRTEIAGVKTEFRTEIAGVKTEFRTEIAGIKGDIKLLRWMVGFNLALTVAVLWLLIRS
jgi:hypothetical protein